MSKRNRSKKLFEKRKRRERRKANRGKRVINKQPVGTSSVSTFSRAAWNNVAHNNGNVLKNMSKSKIKFNRDAWQIPISADRPTVTEPHTGKDSQKDNKNG
jgi:hypothetical protein